MRLGPDTSKHDAATAHLSQVGVAALPQVEAHLAERHLALLAPALTARATAARRTAADTPARVTPRRPVIARQRMLVLAGVALIAIPSMAFAGVLPDPVQRVASRVASAAGVNLPSPAADRAKDVTSDVSTSNDGARGTSNSASSDGANGLGLGDETRGTVPGKPGADDAKRGNRFGQVEAGPDQGKASPPAGGEKPKTPPASSSRPTTPPAGGNANSGSTGATDGGATAPAPSAEPTPAAPAPGGGNGGGKPDKG